MIYPIRVELPFNSYGQERYRPIRGRQNATYTGIALLEMIGRETFSADELDKLTKIGLEVEVELPNGEVLPWITMRPTKDDQYKKELSQ